MLCVGGPHVLFTIQVMHTLTTVPSRVDMFSLQLTQIFKNTMLRIEK